MGPQGEEGDLGNRDRWARAVIPGSRPAHPGGSGREGLALGLVPLVQNEELHIISPRLGRSRGAGRPSAAQSPPLSPTVPNAPTPAGRFTVRMGVVARAGGRAGSVRIVTPLSPKSSTEPGGRGPTNHRERRGSPLVKADIKNINLPSPIPPPSRGPPPHRLPRVKAQSSEAR